MYRVAILWLAFFVGAASAQDLKITGQNVRVVTVIDGAPFQVEAPKGGFGYAWTFPPSMTATRKANILEVTAAPKGTVTVSVEWYIVDFDKRTIESRASSITFAVGEPGPGPKPPDSFTQSLIDAYKNEPGANKAEVVAFFVSLYRNAAKTDAYDASLANLADLYARLVAARKRQYADDVILPMRTLIEAELNALVKPVSDQPLDASTRDKVANAFNRVATALEAVK